MDQFLLCYPKYPIDFGSSGLLVAGVVASFQSPLVDVAGVVAAGVVVAVPAVAGVVASFQSPLVDVAGVDSTMLAVAGVVASFQSPLVDATGVVVAGVDATGVVFWGSWLEVVEVMVKKKKW